MVTDFREKEEGGERQEGWQRWERERERGIWMWERNINRFPLICSPTRDQTCTPGTCPDGNQTHNFLVHGQRSNQLSHPARATVLYSQLFKYQTNSPYTPPLTSEKYGDSRKSVAWSKSCSTHPYNLYPQTVQYQLLLPKIPSPRHTLTFHQSSDNSQSLAWVANLPELQN